MKAVKNMKVLAGFVCLLVMQVAQADMLVEKETTLVDPLRGKVVSQETVLFRDTDFAVNEKNSRGLETKTIVHNQGEELTLINYEDMTYSLFDQYLIDSMTSSRPELEKESLDSLRSLMTINRLDVVMTGDRKNIGGVQAEEFKFDLSLGFKAPVIDDKPVPVEIVVSGSQWIAGNFEGFENYRQSRGFLYGIPGRISRNYLGDYSRILRLFGAEENKITLVSDLLTRLMLEGRTHITIQIGADDGEDLKDQQIPSLSWTVMFDTRLINISFDKIPDSEFEIPRGYRKVHNAFDKIGDFIVPGLEKWFALDKRF